MLATPIPVILLSGFLGSGKTTLLKRWLADPTLADAVVIVNELGEVGLDHAQISSVSDAVSLLENGCACCEGADQLEETLERLFWARLKREIPRFERVFVELSGVADPGAVRARVSAHHFVGERFEIAPVVVAWPASQALDDGVALEAQRQLEAADLVILTHADTVPEDEIDTRKLELAAAGAAYVLCSAQASLSAAEALVAIDAVAEARCAVATETAHAHRHTTGLETAFLPALDPIDEEALAGGLSALIPARGWWRAKGVFLGKRAAALVEVQAVRHGDVRLTPWGGALTPRLGITLIGANVDLNDVVALAAMMRKARG